MLLLNHQPSGDPLEIDDLEALFDPGERSVRARNQAGQEEQDARAYPKGELVFPSGESLPRCWSDPEYRLAQTPS